jgi:hydrogenase nickel incorporation protein HypB
MHRERAEKERIDINQAALKANEEVAMRNRHRFLNNNVLVTNIMGAPGSGKTTLLEALIPKLNGIRIAVIEGDVAGDADSQRIRRLGIVAYQINTYGACHLLAYQVEHAYEHILEDMKKVPNLVMIENVGNLVCPAEFDLGEAIRVVVYSATEGDDKPQKYPLMFLRSQVVVLNKADISTAAGYDIESLKRSVQTVNPAADVFVVSAKQGTGIDSLAKWFRKRVNLLKKQSYGMKTIGKRTSRKNIQ